MNRFQIRAKAYRGTLRWVEQFGFNQRPQWTAHPAIHWKLKTPLRPRKEVIWKNIFALPTEQLLLADRPIPFLVI
jgi:hypothetical protein